MEPGRKLGNHGNLRNLGSFFPRFLNPSFWFWLYGCTVKPATLLKKRLQNKCFPANIVKFLRTVFFIEHPQWLLLKLGSSVLYIYVMHSFQSLSKCFFLQQKYVISKILQCHNKICLLWGLLLTPGPSPWKTWTQKNLDPEKRGKQLVLKKRFEFLLIW